ncbi:MAG: radical SAM protein [Desulfobacterales bacterium]|nr:MAG: radical SAM protein [Desulfobacterales bacterium]
MNSCRLKNLDITLNKQGANRYTKASYPIRYGRFCEIKSPDYLFQLNLNGEIKYIRGVTKNWPHPAEWLKRTDGNDWVFYSIAGYHRIFDSLGEYYLPCLPYASNSIWAYNPFGDCNVQNALAGWSQLQAQLRTINTEGLSSRFKNFLDLVAHHDAGALQAKSEKLHKIIGGRVSVLPPDTRHVDYEVIPLIIADGCLYNCSFCRVKSGQRFMPRSKPNVRQQIRALKSFYGANLKNYNAVFLGNHDALAAGDEHIRRTAIEVYKAFNFEKAHISEPRLFLFGSVDSLLSANNKLFEALNRTPFYTYINIGLESADGATLSYLRKPLENSKIKAAFLKMIDVNRNYFNIEITANFLIGDRLPPDHYGSVIELVRDRLDRFYSKGGIYLSPLDTGRNNRDLLRTFFELKSLSRLPTFLYLIQRL